MIKTVYYLCSFLIEPLIILSGLFADLLYKGYRYEAEKKIRGFIYALFYNKSKIRLGSKVRFEGIDNIHIGNGVSIYEDVDIIAGTRGLITIGDNTHIGKKSVINGSSCVQIGANCAISSHVSIYSVSNTPRKTTKKAKVVIGDNVLIGASTVILPGIEIGDNASIGAGSVVTKNVSQGRIVAGIPAEEISN